MKTHTHTTTTFTIPGTEIEVELPFKPDGIMEYKEPLVRITDDKIVLGYLAHDPHCENPLESDEFMGHIYEARRHSATLGDYCRALGLREDGGGPNLDLVPEEDVVAESIKRILADDDWRARALEYCYDHWERGDDETDEYFLTSCLDTINELAPVFDVDQVQRDLWQQGRRDGTIGNKYAVMLDVYEHGGIAYSLSGTGMQCQFDTARGGAVWVPNVNCVEEIQRRGEVYRKGAVVEQRSGGYAVFVFAGVGGTNMQQTHANLPWYEAFQALQASDPGEPNYQPLEDAEDLAAREAAKEAAETYTDWVNGNCYFTVVATYEKVIGRAVEPLDFDTVGGYVGGDYAYESLKNGHFPKEDEDCKNGMHSWVDEVGKLPPDTKCTRCGESYGDPD